MDIVDGRTISGLKRLEQIGIKNKCNPNWINQDLYRLLYKEDMYISAYENIKSNKGALTPAFAPAPLAFGRGKGKGQGVCSERTNFVMNK